MARKKRKAGKKVEKISGKVSEGVAERVSGGVAERENQQLFWVIAVFAVVFAVFIFSAYFIFPRLSKFEYLGLEWEKIKEGNINFYYSQFRLFDSMPIYNAYFRTDPRKNNVSADVEFRFFKNVVVSLDPNTEVCKGANVIGNKMLGEFLAAMGINARGAVADAEKAIELNLSYAGCESALAQNVFIVRKSNATSIKQDKDYAHCYLFDVGDCENIKVSERFILRVIEQLREEKRLAA